jgi:putative membrane protein
MVKLIHPFNPARRKNMRYVYLALIILITLAVLTFKIQNLDSVTVSFLSFSITAPVSLLMLGVYFLGMFTGGMVVSLVRGWVRGATRTSAP